MSNTRAARLFDRRLARFHDAQANADTPGQRIAVATDRLRAAVKHTTPEQAETAADAVVALCLTLLTDFAATTREDAA